MVGRHPDTLEQAAHEILGERGTDAVICSADLSEADAPQAIFDHPHERGIAVNLLVNSAGLLFDGDFTAIRVGPHARRLCRVGGLRTVGDGIDGRGAEGHRRQGIAACLAGDTVCVAGIYNSLLARGVHLVPREVTRTVAGCMARQLR